MKNVRHLKSLFSSCSCRVLHPFFCFSQEFYFSPSLLKKVYSWMMLMINVWNKRWVSPMEQTANQGLLSGDDTRWMNLNLTNQHHRKWSWRSFLKRPIGLSLSFLCVVTFFLHHVVVCKDPQTLTQSQETFVVYLRSFRRLRVSGTNSFLKWLSFSPAEQTCTRMVKSCKSYFQIKSPFLSVWLWLYKTERFSRLMPEIWPHTLKCSPAFSNFSEQRKKMSKQTQ